MPELKPIPKHSLKRFTTPLINNGGKMLELVKAKYAPIKVTYKGDKWAFNVDVYKEKESSSSSTKTSSESKASSSDDSQTETRMSSSSSSSS